MYVIRFASDKIKLKLPNTQGLFVFVLFFQYNLGQILYFEQKQSNKAKCSKQPIHYKV